MPPALLDVPMLTMLSSLPFFAGIVVTAGPLVSRLARRIVSLKDK